MNEEANCNKAEMFISKLNKLRGLFLFMFRVFDARVIFDALARVLRALESCLTNGNKFLRFLFYKNERFWARLKALKLF
jgi:hypothetical protein